MIWVIIFIYLNTTFSVCFPLVFMLRSIEFIDLLLATFVDILLIAFCYPWW